jgi:FkbM family methyltransferase
MRKIIFSKQCDHDLDIMPFWLHWYQNVFRADEIIITPVRTVKSSIDQTASFYTAQNIPVYPLEYEGWDDGVVWRDQLDVVKSHCSGDFRDAVIVSADADQFFSPVDRIAGPEAVFRRVFLYADSSFTPETFEMTRFTAYETMDLLGAFYNSLDSERIHATGHFAGICRRESHPCEFHLSFRGFSQFLQKVSSLAVESDNSPGALHWKKWVEIFKTRGEEGLKSEYDKSFYTNHDSASGKLTQAFCQLAAGGNPDGRAEPVKLDVPFGSQLLSTGLKLNSGAGSREKAVKVPLHEFYRFLDVFKTQTYYLDSAVNTTCLIDASANTGAFSLYMKTLFPEAKIFAYEAVPDTFTLLENNLGGFTDVVCQNVRPGVSDGAGTLYRHYYNSFEDSIFPGQNRVLFPSVMVRVRSVGSLIKEALSANTAEGVAVLRIVVEEEDVSLLRGAGINLSEIKYLFIESKEKKVIEEVKGILSDSFETVACPDIPPFHILRAENRNL